VCLDIEIPNKHVLPRPENTKASLGFQILMMGSVMQPFDTQYKVLLLYAEVVVVEFRCKKVQENMEDSW
jgi:hypothetical protein